MQLKHLFSPLITLIHSVFSSSLVLVLVKVIGRKFGRSGAEASRVEVGAYDDTWTANSQPKLFETVSSWVI